MYPVEGKVETVTWLHSYMIPWYLHHSWMRCHVDPEMTTLLHTCRHTDAYTYTYTYTHMRTHTHTHKIYTHACTHVYIHIRHIHTIYTYKALRYNILQFI